MTAKSSDSYRHRRTVLRAGARAERLELRRLLSGLVEDGGIAALYAAPEGDHYVAPKVQPTSRDARRIDPAGLSVASGDMPMSDVAESEPNNTAASADPITVSSTLNVITASLSTSSDLDYYSFTLGQRTGVFFDIDSRETGLSATLNTALNVYASNGTTVVGSNGDGDDFETFPLNDTSITARNADSALYLDLNAGSYFVAVSATSGSGSYQLKVRGDTNYSPSVPALNSLAGAADTLYLDFDGHSSTNDSWATRDTNPDPNITTPNGAYTIVPFDFSGNAAEWTPGEKAAIETVWRGVAEDYAPFNINVSTVLPASFNNGVGFRQVIGNSTGIEVGFSGSLGVAFLSAYAGGTASNNTAFTFANSFSSYVGTGGDSAQIGAKAVEMANTSSHEFGHALGLKHYGGSGATSQFNGLMHTPDFGLSRERWKAGNTHDGEPPSTAQDDVAVISNATNTFGYKADDHGNTRQTASPMSGSSGVFTANGIIGQTSDVDFFSFTATDSTTVSVTMLEHIANLDAELYLYNSAGTLVTSSDPGTSIFASVTQTLPAGTYYAEVRSDAGQGEIGQYTLNVVTSVPSAIPGTPDLLPAFDTGFSNTDNITNLDNIGAARELEFSVSNTIPGADVLLFADGVGIGVATATGTTTIVRTLSGNGNVIGTRAITARQFEPGKGSSADSAALSMTVDNVAPATPSNPDLSAGSDTGSSSTDNLTTDTTPTFNVTGGAPYFRLFVGTVTQVSGDYETSSVTLAAQAAGTTPYTAVAVDVAGNVSDFSANLNVTIDTTAPTISTYSLPLVTTNGTTTADFTVTFSDAWSIDFASLNTGDFVVSGPNAFSQTAAFVSVNNASNGTPRTATYRTTAPGGTWDAGDNGSYTPTLQTSQVRDVAGNAAASIALNPFVVDIGPPTIGSLSDSPDPVTAGANLTLTANSVADPQGSAGGPLTVSFYRESNSVAGLQVGGDTLVGTDTTGPYSVVITAPAGGTYTYYAQVTDSGNLTSSVVSTTNTVNGAVSTAPGTPDLLAATDSGSPPFDTDNRTNFDNSNTGKKLQFNVPGTTAGSLVTIYADNVAIGSATAPPGTTTPVTTSGTLDLLDGVRSITARQTESGKSESVDSTALAVTIDTTGPVADVVDVSPDPRSTGVSSITINFDAAITGFDLGDLSLTRNGGSSLLTGSQTLTTSDSITFSLNNLSSITSISGSYTLAPNQGPSGITDVAGNAITAGASDTWVHSLPAWLAPGSVASWNSSTKVLTVTAAATIVADPGADLPMINASVAAAILTIDPASQLAVHVGALHLSGGATATLVSLGGARTASNHRALVVHGDAADLTITGPASRLDLADNDLVFDYDVEQQTPLAYVADLVAAGFGTGDWLGAGIASSAIPDATIHGLGYAENATLPEPYNATDRLFGGVGVDSTSVLLKFTWIGDLNIDGRVNFSDVVVVNGSFDDGATSDRFWYEGDFDYNGPVDFSDLVLFNGAYDETRQPV